MKELTKAEEQIMQILWDLKRGFIKDIAEQFEEPRPASTTISTVVKILETKGFVGHRVYGKIHEYYPVISKEDYTRVFMGNVVKNYFSNSYQKMVSFFARDKEVSIEEMSEMMKVLQEEMKKKQSKI
jgi:BlaI family transcriptional regulator, penicillinase repressor